MDMNIFPAHPATSLIKVQALDFDFSQKYPGRRAKPGAVIAGFARSAGGAAKMSEASPRQA
jgi:hypothetical protein